MPAAAIAGGASIVGGMISSSGAKSASRAQERAAQLADETQRYMYDTTRADNAPFRNTGVAANNRLAYLMGLGGTSGSALAGTNSLTRDQIRSELLGQYTTQPTGKRNLRTDHDSSYANNRARILNARNSQSVVDEAGLNAAIEARLAQQSQSQAAANAAELARSNDPAYGSLSRNFSYDDLNNDVVYNTGIDFALGQGSQALNRQAAASGSLLSGAAAKALTRFGAQVGNQYAGDARNRFVSDQDTQYNRLAGLSGAGQTATAQVGAAGQNYANQVSNNQIGLGNARGASAIAQGNALSGAIGNIANNYQQQNYLNQLNGGGNGFGWAGNGGFGDSYSTSYGE